MPLFKNESGKYVLYIHIPKAGGTSVKSLIKQKTEFIGTSSTSLDFPVTPQHFHRDLLTQVGYDTIAESSFTIVREPLERLISEYKYRKKNSKLIRLFLDFDSFVCFILMQYKKNSYVLDNHIRPQTEFFFVDTNVFKLEDGLPNILSLISSAHDMNTIDTIRHENRSKDEQVCMNMVTFNKILHFYADDYKKLCYEKPLRDKYKSKGRLVNTYIYVKCCMLSFVYTVFRKVRK